MFETFFGFKKTPFASAPDPKQLFESAAWAQLKARLQFLTDHRGAGLLTGEVGSGKSTAARTWLAGLNRVQLNVRVTLRPGKASFG